MRSLQYFILRYIPTDHDNADMQKGTKCNLNLRRYSFSVPFGRAQIIARLRDFIFPVCLLGLICVSDRLTLR